METKKLGFTEMEEIEGGMSCWFATTLLVAAGVSFVAAGVATGGTTAVLGGIALNSLGLGGAYYGYLEACHPELLE